jgi:hypothetical protein
MFPSILLQNSNDQTLKRRVRNGGSVEIRPCELMASLIYGEKFPTGVEFLFRTSSFTSAHDDDLKHPAQ